VHVYSYIHTHTCTYAEVDGCKYIMVRIADRRKRQLVEATARMLMYYTPPTRYAYFVCVRACVRVRESVCTCMERVCDMYTYMECV
jgi:hypothetical protein